MKIDATAVLGRRRSRQQDLLALATQFADGLDPALAVQAVVVFGSVARGDFNVWSDIDVLVVADRLPARGLDRLDVLGPRPGLVQPLAWTPDELRQKWARSNPIAREAAGSGIWLVGRAEDLGLTEGPPDARISRPGRSPGTL